ncbi:hypothetical protein RF11_05997 [Thelohanellus kitauei]|uniref:F-box domain-containing protein n=1 Tax=Thelohanellus kitauei TaxID=669202 RepID=A0A0C2N6U5_THEKT|nr:hypothetical protein RF11_05997 [Thelohanellus kitauei]
MDRRDLMSKPNLLKDQGDVQSKIGSLDLGRANHNIKDIISVLNDLNMPHIIKMIIWNLDLKTIYNLHFLSKKHNAFITKSLFWQQFLIYLAKYSSKWRQVAFELGW